MHTVLKTINVVWCAIRADIVRQCLSIACSAGPCGHLKMVKQTCSWECPTLMHQSELQVWKIRRWALDSLIYGIPKVCFESHMSWNSLFDPESSALMSAKIVVGNVPQPIFGKFCVGVSFYTPLHFLLLTQNVWRKGIKFQPKCVFFSSHGGIIRKAQFFRRFYDPQ